MSYICLDKPHHLVVFRVKEIFVRYELFPKPRLLVCFNSLDFTLGAQYEVIGILLFQLCASDVVYAVNALLEAPVSCEVNTFICW